MKKHHGLFILLFSFQWAHSQVVINEVYGGGNNANAAYNNDFVELFNKSTTAANIGGYKIEYFSASTGGSGGSLTLPAGTILAGRTFYLIKLAGGTANGSPLPAPDATGTMNLSATAGRVDLTNSGGTLIDRVGYGSGAGLLFEGAAAAPAPTNATSVERTPAGTDTDNNSADFQVKNPPTPQNSTAQAPLPITTAAFRAVQKGDKIALYWTNHMESDVMAYAVERSADSRVFSTIMQVNPSNNKQAEVNYSAIDEAPLKDLNFYRIKTTSTGGKIAYSEIIRVNAQSKTAALSLFPNPVRTGTLVLQFAALPPGQYALHLVSASGSQVLSSSRTIPEGISTEKIDVSQIPPGFYTIQLIGQIKLSQTFIRE